MDDTVVDIPTVRLPLMMVHNLPLAKTRGLGILQSEVRGMAEGERPLAVEVLHRLEEPRVDGRLAHGQGSHAHASV